MTRLAGAADAPAVSLNLAATPAAIAPNSTATLTISAANATTVALTGSAGSSWTPRGGGPPHPAPPPPTTTYTATAAGPGGPKSMSATVTVTAAAAPPAPPAPPTPAPPNPAPAAVPSVTAAANPASITADSSSILTIGAANATSVSITGPGGASYALPGSGGMQAVSPASTAAYTVTAEGPGGKASTTVTVTVAPNPAPTVTLAANPASVLPGAVSTLSVNASYASTVVLTGSDGSSYTLPASSAQQAVTPSATTTYTATAKGPGGQAAAAATVSVTATPMPGAGLVASPASIVAGNSATLTVTATNGSAVTLAGSDGTSYNLPSGGGTQTVSPSATTTYTVAVTGQGGHAASASATVTVTPAEQANSKRIDHVVLMLQENHSFDNYFGMLNPYRTAQGFNVGDDGATYTVDGIDDKLATIRNQDDAGDSFAPFKLTSTCVDDMTSSWLESYGDVNRWNATTGRPILMDGFVHTAQGFAGYCAQNPGRCAGTFSDTTGRRAMGYYDADTLNYYYYMASQFAVADRWFTPVSSKSTPNRIATYTGGTTEGLAFDPFRDDSVTNQLGIQTIFRKLDTAGVSWKIYYTVTNGGCQDADDCPANVNARYPATTFADFQDSYKYLNVPAQAGVCAAPAVGSSAVGDTSNSFCIDPNHIAPLTQYFTDAANGTLPQFAYIEAGYGVNDEHPGSGQSILKGQAEVAKVVNGLMASPSWKDSVFFLAYDEAGGPYDHVPPVPGHSNDYTTLPTSAFPPIDSIAVNADSFNPCPRIAGSLHCDLPPGTPGTDPADAAAKTGFAAQIGFRVPNLIVSPFTRRHYVGHTPMDHTAVLRFVENRFIGAEAHLTARDAAQPDLLDFFDFTRAPWATPPAPPAPLSDPSGSTCHADSFAP